MSKIKKNGNLRNFYSTQTVLQKEKIIYQNMLKNRAYAKLCLIIAVFGVLISPSCVVTEKSVYFNDIADMAILSHVVPADYKEPTIRPDDILSITVQTIDPASATAVNQVAAMPAVGASSASMVGNQTIAGFLVDKNGEVTMPMLGIMRVAGLTTFQTRELVQERASRFFKDPNVQVRFANYKITVIGEVARPATYTVPNEKVTLLDAIGLAGDLTIYGKRENVLLIRDSEGKKEFARLNLNSSDVFKSPYFYLKQNDVIYIEPGKGKVAANNAARTQTIAIVGTILSVLLVALTRL